eukprot:gene20204-biopygen16106
MRAKSSGRRRPRMKGSGGALFGRSDRGRPPPPGGSPHVRMWGATGAYVVGKWPESGRKVGLCEGRLDGILVAGRGLAVGLKVGREWVESRAAVGECGKRYDFSSVRGASRRGC